MAIRCVASNGRIGFTSKVRIPFASAITLDAGPCGAERVDDLELAVVTPSPYAAAYKMPL